MVCFKKYLAVNSNVNCNGEFLRVDLLRSDDSCNYFNILPQLIGVFCLTLHGCFLATNMLGEMLAEAQIQIKWICEID